jgi:hypothetical protein
MRLLPIIGLMAVSGCDLIFPFATRSRPEGEGGPSEAAPMDAPVAHDLPVDLHGSDETGLVDAGPCQWSAFSTPAPVQGVNTPYTEWTPHLAGQGLTLYFSSNRPGTKAGDDLWVATRTSVSAPFDAAANLAELNTTGNDNDLSISQDQLEIFFCRNDVGIMRSSRLTPTATFSAPVAVQGLDPAGTTSPAGPCLAPDGLALYYHLFGAQSFDLAFATRPTPGDPFTFVRTLDEVNSPTEIDGWPTVSADGLELYFESSRSGSGTRIFRATRTSTSQPFGSPAVVPELSVGLESGDPDLSPDGKTITFAALDAVGWDLYTATRTCLP